MRYLPISGLPLMDEEEASEEVADIFGTMKRELQMPFISNLDRAIANSPGMLATNWAWLSSFYRHTILPQSLTFMILYTVAHVKHCQYCSSAHTVTCRTLGVDEATLEALIQDLNSVAPQRIQEIIRFAVKCATKPQTLVEADYDRVREQGISEEEMVEIVIIAAAANYFDTIADALKVPVDAMIAEALGG
jgi:uncharacterized peroxidase-related enzyme